jgi:hypothetical protein
LDDVLEKTGFFEILSIKLMMRKAHTCKERALEFVPSQKVCYCGESEALSWKAKRVLVHDSHEEQERIILVIEVQMKDDRLTRSLATRKKSSARVTSKLGPSSSVRPALQGCIMTCARLRKMPETQI